MRFDFAFQLVNGAAIGALDGAVGLDGQKNARVAVPSFVARAAAMQGQVVRGNGYGFLIRVAHGSSFRAGLCTVYFTAYAAVCAGGNGGRGRLKRI